MRKSMPAKASDHADPNLVFGILALQLELVSVRDLVAAMNSWMLDKEKPLGQILVDQGSLEDEVRTTLNTLVGKYLDRHPDDQGEYLRRFPALAELRETALRTGSLGLEATLACTSNYLRVAPADEPREREVDETQTASTEETGRFRILRPLTRGGLGAVFVALDSQFNREVALKQILEDLVDDPASRHRFLLEAEITGNLEHPGIVPVYGLGQSAQGNPYYAMRLIRGESLKSAIARFHANGGVNARPVELRRLLRHFLDACNAIDYANSRGVIHRDLKPANIVLGPHGETLVVDWGMAKILGAGPEPSGDEEVAALSLSGRGSSSTFPGSAMGTPAYMSPEQAAAKNDSLTLACDVYGLGATLYSLLTGRKPYHGQSAAEVLERVKHGEFRRPRQIVPRLDRVLEAICLKAMARRPEDRHASARQLANDIELWLADEPVPSVSTPWITRLQRWERRNRRLIRFGGAALFLMAIVSTTAALLVNTSRSNERRLRLTATEQRQLAEERSQQLQQLAAEVLLDEGILHCDSGRVAEGLLKMANSLQLVPAANRHLENVVRTNLSAWRSQLFDLRFQVDTGGKVRIELSRDGSRFATASDDFTVRVWDTTTGQPLSPPLPHDAEVNTAVFDSKGRRVVTASDDGFVRIFDAISGQMLVEPMAHGDWVDYAEFSPDDLLVVSASRDHTARIWDANTGKPLTPPLHHGGEVDFATFSQDGKKVVTASGDGTARVWDTTTGNPLTPPLQHLQDIGKARFDTSGRRIVTASKDRTARVWDATTGKAITPPLQHQGRVNSAFFCDEDRMILTASDDGTAALWSAETGALVRSFRGHRGSVLFATLSPDGRYVATASQDRTAAVWDAATGQRFGPLLHHRDWVYQARFHADGKSLLTSSRDFTVRAWNLRPAGRAALQLEHPKSVSALVFSPDGKYLATGCVDGMIRIWDHATGRCLLAFSARCGLLRQLVYTPDGRYLLVAGMRILARAFDVATGQMTMQYRGHEKGINSIDVDHSGQLMVTASDDGAAIVWDLASGRELSRIRGSGEVFRSARFSPDGSTVITACNDHTSQIWDVMTGKPVGAPLKLTTDVTWAEFSSDGKRIVTGSQENAAHLWETDSRQSVGRPLTHDGFVYRAHFSPDGTQVLTGGWDGTARLWDAVSGRSLSPPLRTGGTAVSIAWDPLGSSAALGAAGPNVVLLYDLPRPMEGTSSLILDQIELMTGLRQTEQGEVIVLDKQSLENLRTKPLDRPSGED
jgi:WD40 repeat protein/serine/threonine protein kinase